MALCHADLYLVCTTINVSECIGTIILSYNSFFTPDLTVLLLNIIFNVPKVFSTSLTTTFKSHDGNQYLLNQLPKHMKELTTSMVSLFIPAFTWYEHLHNFLETKKSTPVNTITEEISLKNLNWLMNFKTHA